MAVYVDHGIRIEIAGDYDLVSEFMQWQMVNKIWPFRGSSSGRGNSIDWFPLEYEEQILDFFGDRLNEDYVDDDF